MKRMLAVALVIFAVVSAAFAQQDQKMSPEQKAAMDAWMKYMTPGEPHKKLDAMIGTWDAKVTSWMAPGAPPQV
jgi:hypothetical protein